MSVRREGAPDVKPPEETGYEDVAVWMSRAFLNGDGYLDRAEAGFGVEAVFGFPFARANDNGTVSIARRVLRAFRRITPNAVWDASDRAWHRRDPVEGS